MQNRKALLITAAIFAAACLWASRSWAWDSKVYIADFDGDSIYIIDPVAMDTWGSMKTGKGPGRILPSADKKNAFVTVMDEDKVLVIDVETDKITAAIDVDKKPRAMDMTPDGKTLLVGNDAGKTISVIDAAGFKETRRLKTANNPADIRISPDGSKAYVSEIDKMEVVDLRKMEVKAGPVLSNGASIMEISRSGDRLYVYGTDEPEIAVLDTAGMKQLGTLKAGFGMKVSPDGKELWFATTEDKLAVYSIADEKVVATLPRDTNFACHIVFSPDGKRVLAGPAGVKMDKVYVFDAAARKKVGEFKAPPSIDGMLYLVK